MRSYLILLLTIMLLSSCQKEADAVAPAMFETRIVGRTWVEAAGEEQPGSDVRVFRAATALTPAAEPHHSFRFDAEGVFTGQSPSPTAGVVVYPGRWIREPNNILRIIPARESGSFGFQIISLHDGRLQLRRVQ